MITGDDKGSEGRDKSRLGMLDLVLITFNYPSSCIWGLLVTNIRTQVNFSQGFIKAIGFSTHLTADIGCLS